ncbi:MAG TPA: DUF4062 domain-containing protein [Thermoanaerobaculia bacterium]|jgi:hypothetical protein|nr:DUF4062 domain-containing protein [Thermoanaerobaculia bacterium]
MSITVPRVFISSTSEFAAERDQLKKAIEALPDLRVDAYIYEAEAAGSEAPEQRLRKVLNDSEIFLLILGDKFGSEYPGRPTSIVEWEYDYAKSERKELKGYVKDPLSPNADPRQAAFVARAVAFQDGSWVRRFHDAPQMIQAAISDLRNWIIQAGTAWRSGQSERVQWKDRFVLVSGAVVALATVAGVVIGALKDVPMEKLALIFACGVTMFGGLWLFLKSDVF